MSTALDDALARLSTSQQIAASFQEGAALVLAGPGVGKTTVLTARAARLVAETPKRKFKILALTFTTKAGDEMRDRIEQLIPDDANRISVGTFHSFCTNMLRQHGSHLGIRSDFGVYEQENDLEDLLKDGLRAAVTRGEPVSIDDVKYLKVIGQLRANLVGPAKAQERFRDKHIGLQVARVYKIYEDALRERNVMDFSGMILDACRLAHQVPEVAARTRQTYPYWLIDEFQDTTPAQYRLIKFLAGPEFKNVFAVADDDQIIYQWAGASYGQIAKFREEFQPKLIQLVENRRCPPAVVEVANNLVAHNKDRTPGKEALIALKPNEGKCISERVFDTDQAEADGIAEEIVSLGKAQWGKTVVLARTRTALNNLHTVLKNRKVNAVITTRRDGFVSPQFAWLYAVLDQAQRPSDRRVASQMALAANRFAKLDIDPNLVAAEADAGGKTFLEQWALAANGSSDDTGRTLGALALKLVQSRDAWKSVMNEAIPFLVETAPKSDIGISDASEDEAAWKEAAKAVRKEKGDQPDLAELLQGIALRPKEPPYDPDAVRLSTIHAAKGLEFDRVYVIGLAEGVLPSWQSLKGDAKPADLEEERRNCFVAITRTRRELILSRAKTYQGRPKEPSRFLKEMGLPQG